MIPQIEPWINEDERDAVTEVITSTWLTESNKTAEFETRFKELTGAAFARAMCNGTLSLFASLKILGIGPKDEVIIPNLTFIATGNAVLLAGATPVVADVDKKTFTLSPEMLEAGITDRTKAIIPVHLYGQSADMDAIMRIARIRGLSVIEDAAQGVGVTFAGRHVGTFGDCGCFSFYGNKTITTGEGGMIITQSAAYDAAIYALKNHGRSQRGTFIHEQIGYNFSLNELAAAIGISQLNKLDQIRTKKKALRQAYEKYLAGVREIEFTGSDERCVPVHWFINILVEDPAALQKYLHQKGIGSRRFFYPINKQPCYNLPGDFPNSEYAYEHGLSLPSAAMLDMDIVQHICQEIKNFYGRT